MPNNKEIKRVVIETIPMVEQRYNTVGDWFFQGRDECHELVIRVSDTGDWKWNMALALHELVEAILCTADGVSQEQVDKFDLAWDSRKHLPEDSEPGDDVDAPYHSQHRVALALEQQLFDEFYPELRSKLRHVEWLNYEDKLKQLTKEYANNDGPIEEERTDEV